MDAREVHNQLRAALERALAARKEELSKLNAVIWAFENQRGMLEGLIDTIERALREDDQAAQPQ